MHDIDLGGFYAPFLLPVFAGALAAMWALDALFPLTRGHVWHPALFRAAIFTCLFGGAALIFYS